ncbi:hypothetical protein WJX81_008282 [Elliptochloris bilobata]|uniref:Methyltransferase domain-containing protein n=1 Tax=Elliptochloris bilobata TaxID=381761 RepID=A0AAW1S0I1_9CHLO
MLEALGQRHPGFRYHGLDVVRSVVADNQRRFAQQQTWAFELADITQGPLPSGYELILCRDALQHLPFSAVIAALENFARSDTRYLLVGSYMRLGGNKNIAAGQAFDIDLMQAPFGLDAPLMAYNELTHHLTNGSFADKHLLLYSMEALRAVDWDAMRERAAAVAASARAR